MVLNPKDEGTFNFFSSGTFWGDVGHGLFDMSPWIVFGNNDEDPGPILNEIIRLFE